MKKIMFLAAVVFAVMASGQARAQDTPKEVTVTYNVNSIPGPGSNQIAVWVEGAGGNYVRSLYASAFTAAGGYERRPVSLSVWTAKSDWKNASQAEKDAVSGATQQEGKNTVVWDLKDKEGKIVPNGKYVIKMEANLKNERKMFLSAEVSVGGGAAATSGVIYYEPADASGDAKIFEDVTVTYK